MYIGEVTISILNDLFVQTIGFLPQLIAGLVVLIIGIIVARVLQSIVKSIFGLSLVRNLFNQVDVEAQTVSVWATILGEIVRWTVILLFLVPAAEIWGIPRVTEVFTQLLLYIPNVFVAVFVGFAGMVIANLVGDVVEHGAKSLGAKSRGFLSSIARYSILFFTVLIVLNQLGIAADLIRILFTGIVAMLALAGGLAFGLGGKDIASEILKDLKKKLK